jgi:hypothetical protein
MLSYQATGQRPSFSTVLSAFACDDGLPFADVLTEEHIQQACDDHGVHFGADDDDVWTPALTLWTFLSQCLSAGKSCVAAVARAVVLRVALGLPPCSANTGPYCKARAKLPEGLLRQLALAVGSAVEDQAPDDWRWYRRRVLLADGFEVSLPDTPANQRAYPQPKTPKPGLGFPQMRLVVLLAFASCCLVGCALGPCQGKQTGETALFRQLLGHLRPGDVVVADRYYCSYWLVALLQRGGADVCFRLHQSRDRDFRRGRRLGRGDRLVGWERPPRPEWMDEDTYQQMPLPLQVRLLRVRVDQPGCRVRQLDVATTLVDARAYPHADVADLYHQRWHVELDIRNIKQALQRDVLRCQSPAMARKEVWCHLLGYNLIRKVLAQAAVQGGYRPRQLSFQGGLDTLEAFRWALLCVPGEVRGQWLRALLGAVATHRVGNRPGRVEPREVKRRRQVRLMTVPRAQRRAELLGGRPAADG